MITNFEFFQFIPTSHVSTKNKERVIVYLTPVARDNYFFGVPWMKGRQK